MRWPNRHPHSLTPGMRAAQRALAAFLPLINWQQFRRRNWNEEVKVLEPAFVAFACGDEAQAVIWLLRQDTLGKDGMLQKDVEAGCPALQIPALSAGCYRVTAWDTRSGTSLGVYELSHSGETPLSFKTPPVVTDLALAIKKAEL